MNRLLATIDRARIPAAAGAWLRLAPRAAAAAIALVVAVQLGLLARAISPLLAARDVPQTNSSATVAGVMPTLDALADAHLFGSPRNAAPSPPKPQDAAAVAPATQLDVTLTGTLVGVNGMTSEAIIGDGRNERTYRLGDVLDGGVARVYAIEIDRVVLEREGQLETLQPPEWQTLKGTPGPTPSLAAAEPVPALGLAARPPATPAPATSADDILRFTAYNEGAVAGLRAHPGRDKQTFQMLGLQPGDVITSVDGEPLGGMNSSALLSALRTKPTVNVSIVRRGIPQVVLIPAGPFAQRLGQR